MISVVKNNFDNAKKYDLMFVIDTENKIDVDITRNVYKFSNFIEFTKFVLKNNINIDMDICITGKISLKEINNYKYLLSFLLFYKVRLSELKEGQNKINDSLLKDDDNKIVKEIIEDFIDLNNDGKYIRGTLIALGYYLASEKKDLTYLDLAYAYEMFQTSVLIHDDIIDNARIRRGKETIPRRLTKKYLSHNKKTSYHKDVLTLANSMGICAGDLGFYEANKLLINSYGKNKNFVNLISFYNDIIIKTIKGEIIDVYLPFIGKYNYDEVLEKDILDIYHLKTSWYTIIGPFILGYILSGKKSNKKIENILNKIGIAFQIKDDILGIFSSSLVIGKSNTSDIEEFKQTILYSYIINTSYKKEFLKIYGKKNINEKELIKVRNLLKISGAYEYAINYLDNLYNDVLKDIDKLEIIDEGKDILKGLLIYINSREK